MDWLIISLSMLGKFFITITFSLVWTYSCEAYPTDIRNQGLNVPAMSARISAIVASYVGMLVRYIFPTTRLGVSKSQTDACYLEKPCCREDSKVLFNHLSAKHEYIANFNPFH